MRLSDLPRPAKSPYALIILPFLAFALASPACAEPASNPPTAEVGGNPPAAQNGGTPPSAEVKPNAAAEQPAAGQPKPGPAPAQPKSKSAAAPLDGELAGNGSQILINIDKSRQEMSVFVDGIEKYTWPVSTGKRGYSTPSGTYTAASSMNEIWYSKQWDNAPMPHAIFYMKDGHAIHGTLEERNLGKPASHGCVRISRANATAPYCSCQGDGSQEYASRALRDDTRRRGTSGNSTGLSSLWRGRRRALVWARTRVRSAQRSAKTRPVRRLVPATALWRSARLLPAPARLLPAGLLEPPP